MDETGQESIHFVLSYCRALVGSAILFLYCDSIHYRKEYFVPSLLCHERELQYKKNTFTLALVPRAFIVTFNQKASTNPYDVSRMWSVQVHSNTSMHYGRHKNGGDLLWGLWNILPQTVPNFPSFRREKREIRKCRASA